MYFQGKPCAVSLAKKYESARELASSRREAEKETEEGGGRARGRHLESFYEPAGVAAREYHFRDETIVARRTKVMHYVSLRPVHVRCADDPPPTPRFQFSLGARIDPGRTREIGGQLSSKCPRTYFHSSSTCDCRIGVSSGSDIGGVSFGLVSQKLNCLAV